MGLDVRPVLFDDSRDDEVAAGADEAIILEPPLRMTLERAIEYIAPDEYVEVTPDSTRLRKKILSGNLRKRSERQQQDAASGE